MCCCPTWTTTLLQWHAHSLIVEQGRADITCGRGSGTHSVPSDPGWTASPICSGLICGRHRSVVRLFSLKDVEELYEARILIELDAINVAFERQAITPGLLDELSRNLD